MSAPLRFRVELRVLDCHRRAVSQRQQHPFLFAGHLSRLAVVDSEYAEHFAVDFDRHVKQRANVFHVGNAVRHARIIHRILDRNRLSSERHARGDAFARRVRHLQDSLRTKAPRRTRNQTFVPIIPHEHRARISLQHIAGDADERFEHLLQMQRAVQHVVCPIQRFQVARATHSLRMQSRILHRQRSLIRKGFGQSHLFS